MSASLHEPLRGEIWFAGFDPVVGHEQGGDRPCLVISADAFNRGPAQRLIAVPITTKQRNIATHVRVDPPEGGLRSVSFIICEDVRAISKLRLQARWGQVSPSTIAAAEARLKDADEALSGWPALMN